MSMTVAQGQHWRTAGLLLAVNALLALVVLLLDLTGTVHHWDVLRDPNAIAGQANYAGAYSNLTVLVWAAGGSVALFAWLLLRRVGRDGAAQPLLWGGLFMALVALDDLFMLHESVSMVGGIPEEVMFAGYAGLLGLLACSMLSQERRKDWLLLFLGLASLGLSIMVDVTGLPRRGHVFYEEILKGTGAAFLAACLIGIAYDLLVAAIAPAGPPSTPRLRPVRRARPGRADAAAGAARA